MDRDLVKAITALLPKLRARFGDDDEHVQYLAALAQRPRRTRRRRRARDAAHGLAQARYQRRHKQQGLCTQCAAPRYRPPGGRGSLVPCLACLVAARVARRRKRGHRPWRPGFPGSPPLEARQGDRA